MSAAGLWELLACVAWGTLGLVARRATGGTQLAASLAAAAALLTAPAAALRVELAAPPLVGSLEGVPAAWLCAVAVLGGATSAVAGRIAFGRRPPGQRALLQGAALGGDALVVGLPLVEAFFGAAGVAALALFDAPVNAALVLGAANAAFIAGRPSARQAGGVREHLDGGTYDGTWRAGGKEGRGVYAYPSGARYEGEWRANRKDGRGAYFYASGASYVGEWAGGLPHGLGVRTATDGAVRCGRWEAGQLAEPMPRWQCDSTVLAAAAAAAAARDTSLHARDQEISGPWDVALRVACFPPLIALVVALAMNAVGAELAPDVAALTAPLAAANRPLALVALGAAIEPGLRRMQLRALGTFLVFKYGVGLGLGAVLWLALPAAAGPLRDVVPALCVLPVPWFALHYAFTNKNDASLAAAAVATSAAVSTVLVAAIAGASRLTDAGLPLAVPLVNLVVLAAMFVTANIVSQQLEPVRMRWAGDVSELNKVAGVADDGTDGPGASSQPRACLQGAVGSRSAALAARRPRLVRRSGGAWNFSATRARVRGVAVVA